VEPIDKHEFSDEKKEVPVIGDVDAVEPVSSTTTTAEPTPSKPGIVPRIEDEEEAFNDVLGDVNKTKAVDNSSNTNKGIDDGLVTIEAVQK
jgi:hypothetical protein